MPDDLVLIPGLGSNRIIWDRTIAFLPAGVRCRVADTLQDPRLPAMAERLLASAPSRFALAGVSMGGMVALEVMRIAPDRVTHLALFDTTARPDTRAQRAYRHLGNLVVSLMPSYDRLSERFLPMMVHPSNIDAVRLDMIAMARAVGPKTYVRQNRAVIARRDLRKAVAAIKVPTAVVVGRDDDMTPIALSAEIQAAVPNATLDVIAECGHLPPIEKPQATAALLAGLLKR
jgi:pimeloyl-ACP methyl ester carboxylesterase